MARFEGTYVALVTPMKENFELDFKQLREICDWMINEGIEGIMPLGSLGEYLTLSKEERAKVVEIVMDVNNNRVPITVGTGASTTKEVIYWAEHAKRNGAHGLLSLPPINYRPLKEEVVAHFQELNKVGLPIIAYNNSRDYGGIDLTPSLLSEISKFDNIVAVKETSGDVRRIREVIENTGLEVMIGNDDMSVEAALCGATGWSSGVPNALPREGVKLFHLARDGKKEEAMKLYRKLLPLFKYDASPRLAQAVKYMMELAGKPVGPTRPPRLKLSDETSKDIKESFQKVKSQ